MKGKHFALLLLLVLILGGAAWYLQKDNRASWSESAGASGGKVVNLPLNDVARVTIKTSAAELNLAKKDDTWTVQERAGYPANYEQVSDLLRKIWDLKAVQEVKIGPSQYSRLELVEPGKGEHTGTLVDFKDKDGKSLTTLLLGKKYLRKSDGAEGAGFPAGRYLMPVGGAAKVSLVSETFDDLEPKPERWLQKDFIKIDSPKSIAVAGQTAPMHWKVSRETASADWKLEDAKPDETLDNGKTSSFNSAFSSPSFTDVLAPDAKPADTGLDNPATITIDTFDGFNYTLKIGKLTGDSYPVTVAVSAQIPKERTPGKDEKAEDKKKLDEEFQATQKRSETKLATEQKFAQRAYLVGKFTVESFLKDRSALLAEKKADATPAVGAPSPGGSAPVTATTPPLSLTPPTPATPPSAAVKPVPAASTPQPILPKAATPAPVPVPPPAPAPTAPGAAPAGSTATPAPNRTGPEAPPERSQKPAPESPATAPSPVPAPALPPADPAPNPPAPEKPVESAK